MHAPKAKCRPVLDLNGVDHLPTCIIFDQLEQGLRRPERPRFVVAAELDAVFAHGDRVGLGAIPP